MKEQIFVLNNYEDFDPIHIFECGQCFRWNKEENGSYTGVFSNNVLNVLKENNRITFKGNCENGIIKTIIDYFDLDRDYKKLKQRLSSIDVHMKEAVNYGHGIRILNQDFFEAIISFIISANNNIPRIKGIIERLSKQYGNEILYNNKTYYTFPTIEQLKDVTEEDYKSLGLGYRAKSVKNTVELILQGKVNLGYIQDLNDSKEIKMELLKLSGVGPKVADCVMLFSLKKFEVFPIDVWVRRVMNELYIKNDDEEKVNKKEIEKVAKEKFSDIAGIAQQYLFYWKRES